MELVSFECSNVLLTSISTVGNSSKNSSISSSSVFNQRVYLMTILISKPYDILTIIILKLVTIIVVYISEILTSTSMRVIRLFLCLVLWKSRDCKLTAKCSFLWDFWVIYHTMHDNIKGINGITSSLLCARAGGSYWRFRVS